MESIFNIIKLRLRKWTSGKRLSVSVKKLIANWEASFLESPSMKKKTSSWLHL